MMKIAFLKQPETPSLEYNYRQLVLSNKMLAIEGDGKAALIKLENDYFNTY